MKGNRPRAIPFTVPEKTVGQSQGVVGGGGVRYPEGDRRDWLGIMSSVVLVRVGVVPRGVVRLLIDIDTAELRQQGGDRDGEGVATVAFNGVCRARRGMDKTRLRIHKVVSRTRHMGLSFDENDMERSSAVVEGVIQS